MIVANQQRSVDLPDDVFEPGEVKPAKPVKKKAPNGNPAPKKRSATEVRPAKHRGPWLRTNLVISSCKNKPIQIYEAVGGEKLT
jgi:hypothetical protein